MQKLFVPLSLLCLLLEACSPPVASRLVVKSYPPAVAGSPVEVYYSQEDIPQPVEPLGLARVVNNPMTVTRHCDSINVVNQLKEEVRQAGGNAVYVYGHIRPYNKVERTGYPPNSCHQMWGVLLRTSGGGDSIAPIDLDDYAMNLYTNPPRLYPRFRFSAEAGYATRLGQIPEDVDETTAAYLKKLDSGVNITVAFDYFFKDFSGLSLLYSGFFARSSAWASWNEEAETVGKLRTKDNIHFVGPALIGRTPFSKHPQWAIDAKLGIGYIRYLERNDLLGRQDRLTGNAFGMYWEFGLEYKFTDCCGTFLHWNLISGTLNNATYTDPAGNVETRTLEKEDRLSVGTMGVRAGLRFYIK